jgi:hypothetical protein
VSAGDPGEIVLRVADQLCAELGCSEEGADMADVRLSNRQGDGVSAVLPAQEESLVRTIKRKLFQIATAASVVKIEGPPPDAVSAALDGAEMVMRGELVSGNADRLLSMMPSFVFLVTVPVVEHGQALALSRRTAKLIEQEHGDDAS